MDDIFGFGLPPGVTNRDIARRDNLLDDEQELCTRCEYAFDVEFLSDCDECNVEDLCESCMDRHTCVQGPCVAGGKEAIRNAWIVIGCAFGVFCVLVWAVW